MTIRKTLGVLSIASLVGFSGCYRQEPTQQIKPEDNYSVEEEKPTTNDLMMTNRFAKPVFIHRAYSDQNLLRKPKKLKDVAILNIRVGDFDGDRDLDIIGLTAYGSLVLYDNLTIQDKKGKLELEAEE